MSIKYAMAYIHVDKVIEGEITTNNVTIWLENCVFYYNVATSVVEIWFVLDDDMYAHPSDVIIRNCNFIKNDGVVLFFLTMYLLVKQLSSSMEMYILLAMM